MPTSTPAHYDVAVCGAGPVGMTAALLLAAHGLDVVVLERRATTSDEPKAISIDDEALRVYQQAGVVDQILPIVVPGTGTRYYDADDKPAFHGGAEVPYRLGYPFKNPFAQPDLEATLHQALNENPHIDVHFGTEVLYIAQDDDTVTVRATDRTVTARYLFGCDGGRSTVRTHLGITMTGRSHSDVWLVVDALGDHHTERFGMHHADPERPHVVVPGLDGRCRYEFRLFEGEGEPTDTPPFELIERLVGALPRDHARSGRTRGQLSLPRTRRRRLAARAVLPARRRRAYDAAVRGPGPQLRHPRRRQPVLEDRRRHRRKAARIGPGQLPVRARAARHGDRARLGAARPGGDDDQSADGPPPRRTDRRRARHRRRGATSSRTCATARHTATTPVWSRPGRMSGCRSASPGRSIARPARSWDSMTSSAPDGR